MAVCNLFAFVIFTLWQCRSPHLLSDPDYEGPGADLAKSHCFVDIVHGAEGASSVWTQSRSCNQYAAMASLRFGYSLMIGVTIITVPIGPGHRRSRSIHLTFFNQSHPGLAPQLRLPSARRLACVLLGLLYPFIILIAIISSANHLILDAVAGAFVCASGWKSTQILLNLLPLEVYFFWLVHIHKPIQQPIQTYDFVEKQGNWQSSGTAVLES